jgi:hypothetical protein
MKLLALSALPFVGGEVLYLNTFDGSASTVGTFKELNDPVMGGQSVGTWSVNSTGSFGILDGCV